MDYPSSAKSEATPSAQGKALSFSQEKVTPEKVEQWILAHLAPVAKNRGHSLCVKKPFRDQGISCGTLVSMTEALEKEFGFGILPTQAFDYPTITHMVQGLCCKSGKARASFVQNVHGKAQDSDRDPAPHPHADTKDPVAVIGMACTMPGGSTTPDQFWDFLISGKNGIVPVPASRWNAEQLYNEDVSVPGTMNTRLGGFIHDVDKFDAAFFGISPREAEATDPQQRLCLESAWAALEHAGINPASLEGSATGVFVGAASSEYGHMGQQPMPPMDFYAAIGSLQALIANRISYALGLCGPSLSMDMACSASLLSVHMARQSLLLGECDLALAGGSNLILSPALTIAFSRARLMSPTGQCRSFDAGANGYVRSEGVGFVVLKRLSEAIKDGNPIWGVLGTTVTNHDGYSNGLTVPNGAAQRSLLQTALAQTGLVPEDISYLETHGTGTRLGDPVEFNASIDVLGGSRASDEPLIVGSLKSAIGHLERAAGIAALIKVLLALKHHQIPPNLHFTTPNPLLNLEGGHVVLPTEPVQWSSHGKPRRAGINSFGVGGSNVHVIVEEPVLPASNDFHESTGAPLVNILPLSAKTPSALRAMAETLLAHCKNNPALPWHQVCKTLQTGRAHFQYRLGIVASGLDEAIAQLGKYLEGNTPDNTPDNIPDTTLFASSPRPASTVPPRICFAFSGQGSQYAGMAGDLAQYSPVFSAALAECASVLDRLQKVSFASVVSSTSEESARLLDSTEYAQPALVAVEYALSVMLKDWGIAPAAALGHSVGEFTALCIAGGLSLEDTLRLMVIRGKATGALPAGGGMRVFFASETTVRHAMRRFSSLCVAAVNGPENTVVSGPLVDLDRLAALAEQKKIHSIPLAVSHAFHSSLLQGALPAFSLGCDMVAFSRPVLPVYSNVTGKAETALLATPEYWLTHLMQPVRFADAVAAAAEETDIFLEIGPHPVLCAMGPACVSARGSGEKAIWIPTLHKKQENWHSVLCAVARLYACGAEITWSAIPAWTNTLLPLPTYAFARESYWFEQAASGPACSVEASTLSQKQEAAGHTDLQPAGINAGVPGMKVPGTVVPDAVSPGVAEPSTAGTDTGAGDDAKSSTSTNHGAGRNVETASAAGMDPVEAVSRAVAGILRLRGGALPDATLSLIQQGLDSLMAVQLKASLDRHFLCAVPLTEFLRTPTITGIASLYLEQQAAGQRADTGTIEIHHNEAENSVPFALTDIQHAYWVGRGEGMALGGNGCQVFLEADVTAFDAQRLEQAVTRLTQRHAMLRMVVDEDGMQRILPEVPPFCLRLEDVRSLPGNELETSLSVIRDSMTQGALDAATGPLYEIVAAHVDENRHRIFLRVDMLAVDGMSMMILAQELQELYANPDTEFAPLAITFRDYVTAAGQQTASPAHTKARQYWENRLAHLPGAPALPVSKNPPAHARFVRHSGRLDAVTWQALKQQAGARGITPSSVLLAAFGTVLSTWSASLHFSLNLTLFDRPDCHPHINKIVGDFTTLILLAMRLDAEMSFASFAQQVQTQVWDDIQHSQVSAVEVLRSMRSAGRADGTDVAPVVFTSLLPLSSGSENGSAFTASEQITLDVVHCLSQTPQVWLDHQVYEQDHCLLFNWDVVEGFFPEGMVEDMQRSYATLLGTLATEEAAWLAMPQAPLDPAHLDRIQKYNPHPEARQPQLLHGGFEVQAAQAPAAKALVTPSRTVTYAELEHMANGLAVVLHGKGALPDTPVAVLVPKGWQQVVAILAVLKSGACYLPLDAELPAARLASIMADSGVTLVTVLPDFDSSSLCSALKKDHGVTSRAMPRFIPVTGEEKADVPPAVYVSGDISGDTRGATCAKRSGNTPDDMSGKASGKAFGDMSGMSGTLSEYDHSTRLAYVIYTSGSTGKPKGVVQDHGSVVNTINDMNTRFAVTKDDVFLGLSTISFDLSVYDLFGSLTAGACLCLPDASQHKSPDHWMELIATNAVTIWNSAPALMQMLLLYLESTPASPNTLRLALLSGDWIPPAMPLEMGRHFPLARFVSLGGATEAAIWSIHYPVDAPGEVAEQGMLPYGYPLKNQTLMPLDHALRPCPVWTPGTLYIGGTGLAAGYWNDPERTSLSFILHPQTGERLYNTGDFGRYLPDGSIEFLGRKDFQVKIRGHRIELGEIETALRCHPFVTDAVALVTGGSVMADGAGSRVSGTVAGGHTAGSSKDGTVRGETVRGETARGGDGVTSKGLLRPDAPKRLAVCVLAKPQTSAGNCAKNSQTPNSQAVDSQATVRDNQTRDSQAKGRKASQTKNSQANESYAGDRQAKGRKASQSKDSRGSGRDVVQEYGGSLSPQTLRNWLHQRLPEYMVPSEIHIMDSFPVTANGKVDRKELLTLVCSKAESAAVEAPETAQEIAKPLLPSEQKMIAVWQKVLNKASIQPHDDFFSLGGDSLLGTRLVSLLRRQYDVVLPLSRLFATPTVADLAPLLEGVSGSTKEKGISTIPLYPDQRLEPFPMTGIQYAYWMGRTTAFELGNVAAHCYMEIDAEHLDISRLSAAWHSLVQRHDMLRATVRDNGTLVVAAGVEEEGFPVMDLRHLAAKKQQEALRATRHEMSGQKLPLQRSPLADIRLSRLPGNTTRIHIDIDNIIADAWSLFLVMEEWARFYEEPDFSPEPLRLTFRDYVHAENTLHESEDYKTAEAYWKKRLPSLPAAPALPLDIDPATIAQPEFVRHSAKLCARDWAALRDKAALKGVTPSAVLLAAYASVLARWSRSRHFTVNVTLFNRLPLHEEVDSLVGDFTSLNMLEADWSCNLPFITHAKQVQERLATDMDHRLYGGTEVLRDFARLHDTGNKAIMPVVFTSALTGDAGRDASVLQRLGTVSYSMFQTPQVWLDHQLYEQEGELVLNWDVIKGLFPAGVIEDMFALYQSLLHDLATSDRAWEAQRLPLPPAQQGRREEANSTFMPLSHETLHGLFMKQVEMSPDAFAVITPERTLTYAGLDAESTLVAQALVALDIPFGSLVPVVMERGWQQVVAALGVLKAGCAYLPVPLPLPGKRLRTLVADAGATVVLTHEKRGSEPSFPPAVTVLRLHEIMAQQGMGPALPGVSALPDASGVPGASGVPSTSGVPGAAGQWQLPEVSPDDMAYVIYTSGSTGAPKGVIITHRGAVNTLLDINTRFAVTAKDRVLGVSGFGFDLSVYDIFGMLAAGAALVYPENEVAADPALWLEAMHTHHVSLWNSAPQLLQMLVMHAEATKKPMPPSLRLAMLSGDWVPPGLPKAVKAITSTMQVVSLGGATEASIWSVLHEIAEDEYQNLPSIPYGKAMYNQQMHVLDSTMDPCPEWVSGDLYIGGVGLASGYWKDEEKTRNSFIIHPETGERLYKTGDLARYLPQGFIEFLGRSDAQLKIRGHRIEPGEIEAALRSVNGVHEALVLATGSGPSAERHLHAFVTGRLAQAESSWVKAALAKELPSYMIPETVTCLNSFPLTANGKVDRSRLVPAQILAVHDEAVQASLAVSLPRAEDKPVELLIKDIFMHILETPSLDMESNFFDMGATSFHLVQIQARVLEKTGKNVPVRDFFLYPTLKALMASLKNPVGQAAGPVLQSTRRRVRSAVSG